MSRMPQCNVSLLKHFACAMHRITRNTEVNQMTASNLAVCIAPSAFSTIDQVSGLCCNIVMASRTAMISLYPATVRQENRTYTTGRKIPGLIFASPRPKKGAQLEGL
jgi:hypothetical protein